MSGSTIFNYLVAECLLFVPSFLFPDAELCKSKDASNHVSGISGGQSVRL